MLQPKLAVFPQPWTSLACGSWPSHGGGPPFSPGSPVRSFENEMESRRVFSWPSPCLQQDRLWRSVSVGPGRALGIPRPVTLWKRLGQLPFPVFLR